MTTLSYFQLCAADNSWAMLAPEILLGLTAILLLSVEWFFPKPLVLRAIRLFTFLTLGVLFALLCYKCCFMEGIGRWIGFSGLILQTGYTDLFRLFFLLSGFLTAHLATRYFAVNTRLNGRVFYPMLLWVVAGFMALVQTHHFASFFVILEFVTVGLYILIAYDRSSGPSLEASLKYLILGALSSPILLMGIALLYGISGNPNLTASVTDGMGFTALHIFISANPTNPFVLLGAAFVLISVAFKIGAFPLQIWIPDVYQGAPIPVTALLAVASKAAGVIVLMNLLHGPFIALQDVLLPIISGVAILTILFGNIAAVPQQNTKRLMGLSGIAHAGYLLLGVVASFSVEWAAQAILFYLLVYLIASYAVFSVMGLVASEDDSALEVRDFANLADRDGFLAFALVVGLSSLAGVPPLAGFVAKFLLLVAAYQAGFYWGLGAALFGVVISIYYYFNWMRTAAFRSWSKPEALAPHLTPIEMSVTSRWVLGALTAVSLVIGVIPAIIIFF